MTKGDTKPNNQDSYNKNLFEFFIEVEKKHFWHIARKEIIYSLLKGTYCEDIAKIKMIEIGCGNGDVIEYLRSKGINIEGGDLFLEALKLCRKRVDAPLYQLDALNTPFHDNQYDVIGLFDVIEHINDDVKVLKEMNRICKTNGRIILTVPANKRLWSYFDEFLYHKRRYNKKELCQKLQDSGFVVEKVSFFVFFLFPLLFIYRVIKNLTKKFSNSNDFSSTTELQTLPVLNYIFLLTLRLEKHLIKIIDLPFGTSLLAIGKKS